jgi:hypothetical protein
MRYFTIFADVKAKSNENIISDGKLIIRFVPSSILSGKINQKTLTMRKLLISNTLLDGDRFAYTDNITNRNISTHSNFLSKYVAYSS